MMKVLRTLLVMFVVGVLASCGSGETPGNVSSSSTRIRALEDSLFDSGTFDLRKAQTLVDMYKGYANTFPKDSLAPEYLFRAANMSKTMHEGEQGVKLYDRIIREYPSWNKIPDVFYLKAFTMDSELSSKGEAKMAYEEVIERFPNHPFAKDARAMIENLQYSDAELIERFQRMQDSTGLVQ